MDKHFSAKMSRGGGGLSHIRKGRDERQATRGSDNYTGQIGEAAGHIVMWRSFAAYRIRREAMLANPDDGDDGDIEGIPVDIKSSRIKPGAKRKLLHYHTSVRGNERRRGFYYVSILVDQDDVAHVIGWIHESMLPAEKRTEGVFAGGWVVRNDSLFPMFMIPLKLLINKRGWITCHDEPPPSAAANK